MFELTEPQSITAHARPQSGETITTIGITGNGVEEFVDDTGLIANLELEPGRYAVLLVAETATAYTLSLSSEAGGDTEGGPLAPGFAGRWAGRPRGPLWLE